MLNVFIYCSLDECFVSTKIVVEKPAFKIFTSKVEIKECSDCWDIFAKDDVIDVVVLIFVVGACKF